MIDENELEEGRDETDRRTKREERKEVKKRTDEK